MAYAKFSSNFSASVITSFSVGSIKADYYAFTKPFRRGFKPYTNMCMALSLPSSSNTTAMLSKALRYSYMEPHCCSSHNLSLAMFLLSKGAY